MLITVEGEWTPWTEWSLCSVTCDGGRRTRSRHCVNTTDISGRELVCSTGSSEDNETCHQFNCQPG